MTQTVDSPSEQAPEPSRASGGDGVGIASFVTGALGLGLVALVLGIIGLRRYRSGAASRRSWPLAGTILGVVGIVVGVALAVAFATSDAQEVAQDAHAQVDVVNALVDWYAAHPEEGLAPVTVTPTGYEVDGVAIPATIVLEGDHGLTLEAPDAFTWCVTLGYSGGLGSEVGYSAVDGLVESCPAG